MRVSPERQAHSTEKEVSSFHFKPGANQRVTDKGAPEEEAAGGKRTGKEREAGPVLMPPDPCLTAVCNFPFQRSQIPSLKF